MFIAGVHDIRPRPVGNNLHVVMTVESGYRLAERLPRPENQLLALWMVDPNHFVLANTGDSRAILSRNHTGLDITKDHKPHDEEELQRIERAGGRVTWEGIPRVNGNLALSRSLGDRSERPAVVATPDLFVLDVSQQDEFIVMATDGLWCVAIFFLVVVVILVLTSHY